MALDALRRALDDRRPDVDVLAEAIAWAREEGWRSCLDRIVDAGLRRALTKDRQ